MIDPYGQTPEPLEDTDWRSYPAPVRYQPQNPVILEGEAVVIPPSAPLIRTPWLFLAVFLLVVGTSTFLAFRLGNRHIAEARLYVQPSFEAAMATQRELESHLRRELDMLRERLLAKRTLDLIGIEVLYPDIGARLPEGRLPFWVELSRTLKSRVFSGSPPETTTAVIEDRRQWLLDSALRRFRGALTVRREGASSFIMLGYRHHDQDMTIAVLEEFLKIYQEARKRLYAQRQARPLQQKLEVQRSRLETLDSRIATLVRKSSMQKRNDVSAVQTARRDELANKIRETQQTLARLEKKLETRRGAVKQAQPPRKTIAVPQPPLDPVVLAGMQETLMNLEKTREQIRALPRTTRKDIVAIEDKIKSLKDFLRRRQMASARVESTDVETQRLQREINALRGQLDTLNQQRDTESGRLQLEFAALWQQLEDMKKEQNALEAHIALNARQERQLETLRQEREEVSRTYTSLLAQWNAIERMNRVNRQALESVRVLHPPQDAGLEIRWTVLFSLLSLPLGWLIAIMSDRLPWRR